MVTGAGSDELPPLPADFVVPDILIDDELLYLQCKLVYDTLLAGEDARPLLWALVKTEGDDVAGMVVRLIYERVGVFLIHHATVPQAFKTSQELARLLVTAREVALRP